MHNEISGSMTKFTTAKKKSKRAELLLTMFCVEHDIQYNGSHGSFDKKCIPRFQNFRWVDMCSDQNYLNC